MRLYLSSFRMGERFDELVGAVADGGRVAVVSNAVDFIDPEARAAYARTVFDPAAHFRAHGLEAFDLDLRTCFEAPAALEAALDGVRLVWANGGNVFLLRQAMRRSGLDVWLRAAVAEGGVIYGGWSAGACVAGPSLRGLELMDDPAQTAPGYVADVDWEGLGLIDFAIVPHFRSDHPEAAAAEACAAAMAAQGLAFRTLRDGEVIVL